MSELRVARAIRSNRKFTSRFWEKVRRSSAGCLLWTGWKNPKGYGVFDVPKPVRDTTSKIYAHRLAFFLRTGSLPHNVDISHFPKCRNRHCVLHVRPLSHRENVLEGNSPSARQARRKRCIHGHSLSERNIYRYGNKRQCKRCMSNRAKARNERIKASNVERD